MGRLSFLSALALIVGSGVVLFGAISLWLRIFRPRYHTFESIPTTESYLVRGIDVSHHNTQIDWDKLHENDLTFVYLKASEGIDHVDTRYADYYTKAKEAGLVVGAYHFYTFALDGKQQAAHFIQTAQFASGDMLPVVDVEYSAINKAPKTDEEKQAIIYELQQLESALFNHFGIHPIIYTNKDGYRQYIAGNFRNNSIWICDLHAEPNIANDRWVLWQFSHTGDLVGIEGNVDLNFYRYSNIDFQNLLIP